MTVTRKEVTGNNFQTRSSTILEWILLIITCCLQDVLWRCLLLKLNLYTRQAIFNKIDWEAFSRELFELVNKVRQFPHKYVQQLESSLDRFTLGTFVLTSQTGENKILTQEGPLAYVEAIEFLKVQKPLKPLGWSIPLAQAANDHVSDLQQTGLVGIVGSDGSLPTDRIQRYCGVNEHWAESTVFGFLTPWEALEQLIVSDGQPQVRGHRNTLFGRSDLNLVGIAATNHPSNESVVSLVFAKDVLPKGQDQKINVTITDKIPEELLSKMKSMGIDTDRIKVVHDDQSGTKAEQRARTVFQQVSTTRRSSVTNITPRLEELSRPTTASRLSAMTNKQAVVQHKIVDLTQQKSQKQTPQINRRNSQKEILKLAGSQQTQADFTRSLPDKTHKKTSVNFGYQQQNKQEAINNGKRGNLKSGTSITSQMVQASDKRMSPIRFMTLQKKATQANVTQNPSTVRITQQQSPEKTQNIDQKIKPKFARGTGKLLVQPQSQLPRHNFKNNQSSTRSLCESETLGGEKEIDQQLLNTLRQQQDQQNDLGDGVGLGQIQSKTFEIGSQSKKVRKTRQDRINSKNDALHRSSLQSSPIQDQRSQGSSFNVEEDPDYPATAMNSHILVEEVEINGKRQRVIRKSYQLVDGTIQNITRVQKL